MTFAAIKTDRLTLRAAEDRDLHAIARLLGDYEVAKMLSRVPYPYDLEAGKTWIASAKQRASNWNTADELPFIVDHEGELIGCVSFRALQQTPQIGYWLGRPYWGYGYMSEAVVAAVGWIFHNTGHETVVSEAMDENVASLRVMIKAGFKVLGETTCESIARGCALPATRAEVGRADFMKNQLA